MITGTEFRSVIEKYVERLGYSSFNAAMISGKPVAMKAAYQQMQDYIDRRRTTPVTNESIGYQGERVIR